MDRKWLESLSKDQLIDMLIKKDESERRYRLDLRWIHQLMSNTTASGDQKQVAYWERFHVRNGEAREDGLFHIRNLDVAKDCGLDPDKIGKVLKTFKERGLAKVRPETKRDETGQIKTKTWIALEDSLLENPRAIDFGGKGNWGGKREKKCESCGSDQIVIESKRRCRCANCGNVDEGEWKLVHDQTKDDIEEEIF